MQSSSNLSTAPSAVFDMTDGMIFTCTYASQHHQYTTRLQKNSFYFPFFCSQSRSLQRPSRQARGTWSWPREAVIPPTCQVVLPLHPSDGGGRLAANGYAGELRLVPLADHVLSALDDWAAWRDWPHSSTNVQTDVIRPALAHTFVFAFSSKARND